MSMNIDYGNIAHVEALNDLYITTDEGQTKRAFSIGKTYKVEKWLHDLRVTNDIGLPHHLEGEYLTSNFRLHRFTAK